MSTSPERAHAEALTLPPPPTERQGPAGPTTEEVCALYGGVFRQLVWNRPSTGRSLTGEPEGCSKPATEEN